MFFIEHTPKLKISQGYFLHFSCYLILCIFDSKFTYKIHKLPVLHLDHFLVDGFSHKYVLIVSIKT